MKVLKLGGSVITKKDEPMTPNLENIKRLACEIKRSNKKKLIIIHGGGSYGHPLAQKFDLTQGYKNKTQLRGFTQTHQAMLKLNVIIMQAFLETGLPTISVSPSSFIIASNDKIKEMETTIVSNYIELGMIPVLFGDPVLDYIKGITILSGDQLAVVLAKKLGAKSIVFGVDIDGVFTSDPKISTNSKLIEVLDVNDFEGQISVGGALPTDVTGGMLSKLREASSAVKEGIEVTLVNAGKRKRIEKALKDEEVTGTRLV